MTFAWQAGNVHLASASCDSGCPSTCDTECPTPTPECDTGCPTPTPEPTATPTPEPTSAPTPTPAPTSGGDGGSSTSNGSSACIPSDIKTTPRIIDYKRINPNTVYVSWGPYEGLNTFIVEYGFKKDSFPYNSKVTGFSTRINDLPTGQQVYVRVAATDNCVIGNYGPVAPTGEVLGLPSTGFGPKNPISWALAISGILSMGTFAVLSKKKWKKEIVLFKLKH